MTVLYTRAGTYAGFGAP